MEKSDRVIHILSPLIMTSYNIEVINIVSLIQSIVLVDADPEAQKSPAIHFINQSSLVHACKTVHDINTPPIHYSQQ